MGNLPRFRGNVVVFTFALLFVVVMIFGNEGGAGIDEDASASGSQRFESPSSAANSASRQHDVALALGKAKHSSPWSANDHPGAEPSEVPLDSSADAAAPSPDKLQVHD